MMKREAHNQMLRRISVALTSLLLMAALCSCQHKTAHFDPSQSRAFFWIMVVLEPALVFLVGMVVFARRRQRG